MDTITCWLDLIVEWTEKHDGFITALATAVIAAFTYALARSTKKLWIEARDAGETAKESANAAKQAAEAARESADVNKLAMVMGNRAYVHFDGCRWISHRNNKDGSIFWRIRPRWINSGNTPTRQASFYVHYEFLDKELGPDYKFTPTVMHPKPASIAPHSSIESRHRDIGGKDLIDVREGRKHFYIWGVARYHDVFPNTPERVTKFCVYASRITGDPNEYWDKDKNAVEILFAGFDRHNCSDEDCG